MEEEKKGRREGGGREGRKEGGRVAVCVRKRSKEGRRVKRRVGM